MHAQIRIGNSELFLNDAMGGGKSLKTIGGSPVGLWIYTEDADALYNKALRAGATVAPGPMGELQDQFWGDRYGTVEDPFGHRWSIATHIKDMSPEQMKTAMDEAVAKMSATHS
jgi:PhnB protein